MLPQDWAITQPDTVEKSDFGFSTICLFGGDNNGFHKSVEFSIQKVTDTSMHLQQEKVGDVYKSITAQWAADDPLVYSNKYKTAFRYICLKDSRYRLHSPRVNARANARTNTDTKREGFFHPRMRVHAKGYLWIRIIYNNDVFLFEYRAFSKEMKKNKELFFNIANSVYFDCN